MTAEPAFAAVDWGTSSFRLWLMAEDGDVLADRRSQEGMASLTRDRFPSILAMHLDAAGAAADVPVVVCGMAGARQGWVEAGYIDVPAPLGAIVGNAVPVPDAGRPVFILPGLAQRIPTHADVIRGEETQLIGAVDQVGGAKARGLLCLPGTHSKWIRLEGETVTGFATFMTGEIFGLLSRHSILSHAVSGGSDATPDTETFATAVREASGDPSLLTNRLFSIRGSQLLFAEGPDAARARLSGLLIGAELAGSGCMDGEPVVLIASGVLRALYEAAFAALGITARTIDADVSVRRGLLVAARALFFDERNGA